VGAPEIKQPAIANEEQDEDSPDEMMDVLAAHHDPIERTLSANHKHYYETDAEEGQEEGDRGEKDAAAGPVRDRSADQVAETGELQGNKQY